MAESKSSFSQRLMAPMANYLNSKMQTANMYQKLIANQPQSGFGGIGALLSGGYNPIFTLIGLVAVMKAANGQDIGGLLTGQSTDANETFNKYG